MRSGTWSAEEDALMRERYVRDGVHACACALDRKVSSVLNRARSLGLVRKPRWPEHDDNALRFHWGEHALPALARMFNRSEATIYWRAGVLGLTRGCPDGFEYLEQAAKRCGYSTTQLRRILKWAHVGMKNAIARRDRGAKRHFHFVSPSDVDAAVAAWLKTECLGTIAKRHGVAWMTLRRWIQDAQEAGARLPAMPRGGARRWRLPSDLVDKIVADRQSSETLKEAARRLRVSPEHLEWWMRWAGYKRPAKRYWRLPADAFTAVVEHRAKRGLVKAYGAKADRRVA